MKYTCFFSVLLSLVSPFYSVAQHIEAKVVNCRGAGIDGVAVVLQTADSMYVDATVTDETGHFIFTSPAASGGRLICQHLLYETRIVDLPGSCPAEIILEEKENLLGEVTVKATRPQVKMAGGALIYDTPQLIKDKPVTNAFEAIRELPGVIADGDKLSLLGAGSVHIVMNGQLTNLTLQQLINMLKSIPASRVKQTEIMYNAPAKYNVKGALINVVIEQDKSEGGLLQGEVGAEYEQRHYAWGVAHTNLLWSTSRFSLDILANGNKGRGYGGENMFARHTLGTGKVEIEQVNRSYSKQMEGTFRLGTDYYFSNKDHLSAAYYVNADDVSARRTSASNFNYPEEALPVLAASGTGVSRPSTLHNLKIQYNSHTELTAGADFTTYHSEDFQRFINRDNGIITTDLQNNSRQHIRKYLAFVNHTYTINKATKLNYGITGSYTDSHTRVEYLYNNGTAYLPDPESNLNNKQQEYGGTVFGELSHTFRPGFAVTAALKAEYFRSDYFSAGKKQVLWNNLDLFPALSLNYLFSPARILQLNIKSNKVYPSYWSINPQVNYLNAYSMIEGNPSLKPSRHYEGQLLYILRKKYILMTFFRYDPDKFTQLPYQSGEELKSIFRFVNLDYSLLYGVGSIIPLKFGKHFSTHITVQGMRLQEKNDNFYDVPFEVSRYFGRVQMNNTITISDAKPNLKLTVSGYYVTPALQGIYKLGSYYDVSGGLKWICANDRATFTVKYENIFRSRSPRSIVVDFENQYSRMQNIDTAQLFGIAFSWKFGGYKTKDHEKVDRSRFGK